MKPTLIAAGLATWLIATVSPLRAQGGVIPLDSAAVAALAWLQPRLDEAVSVRFRTPWGASILENPRLVPTGLGYARLASPAAHRRASPFELQTRGPATWAGLQVGAGVLGVVGAIYGWYFSESCLNGDCLAPGLQGAVAWSLLGAAAGAVIGGVVGSLVTRWRTIYRYPKLTP
jgi:hypothetical protein